MERLSPGKFGIWGKSACRGSIRLVKLVCLLPALAYNLVSGAKIGLKYSKNLEHRVFVTIFWTCRRTNIYMVVLQQYRVGTHGLQVFIFDNFIETATEIEIDSSEIEIILVQESEKFKLIGKVQGLRFFHNGNINVPCRISVISAATFHAQMKIPQNFCQLHEGLWIAIEFK